MRSGGLALTVAAISLLTMSGMVPVANGATNTYLTASISESAIKVSTISGYNGVLVNYTNTLSSPVGSFVYLDLTNSAGQTVYWNNGGCSFAANQKVQCFVVMSSTVPKGNYTASVFVTTNSGIPISTTSSLKVTL